MYFTTEKHCLRIYSGWTLLLPTLTVWCSCCSSMVSWTYVCSVNAQRVGSSYILACLIKKTSYEMFRPYHKPITTKILHIILLFFYIYWTCSTVFMLHFLPLPNLICTSNVYIIFNAMVAGSFMAKHTKAFSPWMFLHFFTGSSSIWKKKEEIIWKYQYCMEFCKFFLYM